jgi:hypothetical protein
LGPEGRASLRQRVRTIDARYEHASKLGAQAKGVRNRKRHTDADTADGRRGDERFWCTELVVRNLIGHDDDSGVGSEPENMTV